MPPTRKNIFQHELIGLDAKVIESTNPQLVGKEGVIMNETKNTLTVKENEDLNVLPKKEITLSVRLPKGEKVKMNGRRLVARPEDRVKKLR